MKNSKIGIIGPSSFIASSLIATYPDSFAYTLFGRSAPAGLEEKLIFFDFPHHVINKELLLDMDAIIIASAIGVQAGAKDPIEKIYGLNSFFPIELLVFLNSHSYKGKVITFGSYFEIGSSNLLKYFSEEEVVFSNRNIPNHYCSSKRILSRFIVNNLLNITYYHLLLPTIYGPDENPNRLIPYLIKSVKSKEKVSLTNGDQLRQYLYVKDLGLLLLELIQKDIQKGIYNISSKEEYTVKEIVQVVSNYFNTTLDISFGTTQRDDTSMKVLLLDSQKLQSVLDWRPKTMLNEVISLY